MSRLPLLSCLLALVLVGASAHSHSGPAGDPLLPMFKKVAKAYEDRNVTAMAGLFGSDDTNASSVYVSHWGCRWVSVPEALSRLAKDDFEKYHTVLILLDKPMSGIQQKSNHTRGLGAVKVTLLGHEYGKPGGGGHILATGYWFAMMDTVTGKFKWFQSLMKRNGAPTPANASAMIAVTQRFVHDWKDGNMTDFAMVLAPDFVANEQNGWPWNRTMFLAMHNMMTKFVVHYHCYFPISNTYCDYAIDELGQTTEEAVPSNVTMNEDGSRNVTITDVWTAEYQIHRYRLSKTEPPVAGLPFQIATLDEFEDMTDTQKKVSTRTERRMV